MSTPSTPSNTLEAPADACTEASACDQAPPTSASPPPRQDEDTASSAAAPDASSTTSGTDDTTDASAAADELQVVEQPWSAEKIEQHLAQARAFKDDGNRHYAAREWLLAIERYTDAIHTAPPQHAELAVFYANRAAAKLQLVRGGVVRPRGGGWRERATDGGVRGCSLSLSLSLSLSQSTPDHEDVIGDCSSALEVDPNYLKALVRRAQSYEKVDKPSQALDGACSHLVAPRRPCSPLTLTQTIDR